MGQSSKTEEQPFIAVIDWNRGGHNQAYLELFAESLLALGCKVLVASPAPPQIDSKNLLAVKFKPRIRCGSSSSWKQRFEQYWLQQRIRACLAKGEKYFSQPCELVFFACLYSSQAVYVSKAVAAINRPWSGLYIQVNQPPEICFPNSYRKLAVLDERVDGVLFPDIASHKINPAALTDQVRAFAGSRPLVSLMGYLQPSKGMLPLLSLAERQDIQDLAFAFVGQLCRANFTDAELLFIEQVKKKSVNSSFYFQRIPDEGSYNSLIQASNILYAAYVDFPHSSNALTKAALFEKPIIVSDGHLMAQRVREYRLGEVVPQNDSEAVLRSIHAIVDDYPKWLAHKKPRWAEYREKHSQAVLKTSFKELFDVYGIKCKDGRI